jgi:hypothetical protein
MESIDQILYNALIAQSTTTWLNSTTYIVGDIVINPDSGALFTCSEANTSTASPQTFTQELTDHPTYWTVLASTLATQAEAEAGVENTKYMSPLRTKQSISALATQTTPYVPHCGILASVSSTLLKFVPWNGNKIKINGNIYDIPAAGIAGLGNTSVFVGTVAGQNLTADTPYLIAAFVNVGVVTANFTEVTGAITHAPSQTVGNEGVETLWNGATELPGQTIIGIVYTDSSAQFVDLSWQRFVRSWFNRHVTGMQTWLSSTQTTVSNTYVGVGGNLAILEWVSFNNELVHLEFGCPFYTASLAAVHVSLSLDDPTVGQNTWGFSSNIVGAVNANMISVSLLVDSPLGYHYSLPLFRTSAGILASAHVNANTDGDRPTYKGMIFPYDLNSAV